MLWYIEYLSWNLLTLQVNNGNDVGHINTMDMSYLYLAKI